MKIRQGKDIILRWKIATNGESLSLEGRNLTLVLSTPNGRERVLSYTTEGDTIIARLFGKEITLLGDYTLTLWENKGEQGQTAVDAVNAFELVKYTTMEGDGSSCGNLEAEVLNLSGELGVFQRGTTTEKNEQVDMNTEDIAELQQDMADIKDDIHALGNSLDDLEKADASLREGVANIKDKDAEQDEEITSLLNILEGKLDIKDLGSGLRPDQAVSEMINYVRSNNIKSALVFKYIDTDNSSTFGICISRMGTSGWIIYLVARKGLEVLKFNSHGSRETWNEYGGVLRHDMNSVADEQLECLSIKGLKSVLAKKQDTLVSGTNIKTINGQTILGSGDITIQGGGGDLTEVNQRLDDLESQALVTEDSLSPEVVTDYSLMSGDIVQTSGTSEKKIMSQKAVTEYIEALRKLAISPSGDPMHNLYISAGAEYNATGADITKTVSWGESVTHKAGYWYLNGIGDLTNEDMCDIYNLKDALTMIVIAGDRGARLLQPCPVKTLYGIPEGRLLDNKRLNGGGAPFISGDIIEVLRWTNNSNKENTYTTVFTLASTSIMYGCVNLHTIERTKIAVDSIIQRCPALRHWHIHSLNISMNMLSGCPNFSAESIHYIIQNAIGGTASAPITITLHSTAKANWEASAYYTEDLTKANELNITIA